MLKKYWIREQSEKISAMIIETESAVDDMKLFTDLQTETYKDVRINPELTQSCWKYWKNFRMFFSDVPILKIWGDTQSN